MSWSQWPNASAQHPQPPVVAAAAGSLMNPAATGSLMNTAVTGSLMNPAATGSLMNTAATGSLMNPAATGTLLNPATTGSLLNPGASVLPPGLAYSTDQWTQMQQQNWQQWAQWQQQYQQWHQQYGAEYQKSISALAAAQQTTVIPNMAIPPPLPTEPQIRPPLPQQPLPMSSNLNNTLLLQQQQQLQYSTQPVVNTFSTPPPNFNMKPAPTPTVEAKRPPPPGGESAAKRQMVNVQGWNNSNAAPPQKPIQSLINTEELSEAEKKFDKQFAEWESQYNKWKEQNSGHPDKEQFKEYEKKWELWRQQLLDRREMMRKKRLGLMKNMNNNVKQPAQVPQMTKLPSNFVDESNRVQETDRGGGLGFLLNSNKSEEEGGIPGLDLVKDGAGGDTDGDSIKSEEQKKQDGPDLEAISKGINSILSDSKLMSMLSLVTKQNFNIESLMPKNEAVQNVQNVQSEAVIQNFDDQTQSSFTHLNERVQIEPRQDNFPQPAPSRNSNNFNNDDNSSRFEDFQSVNAIDRRPVNYKSEEYNDYREEYSERGNGNNFSRNEDNYQNQSATESSFERHDNTQFQRGDSFGSVTMDAPDPPSFHYNNSEIVDEKDYEDEDSLLSTHNIWNPDKVIDYDHKSSKKPEEEILVEPFRMFDYRHRVLRRIPFPERPNWLSDAVRMIPEFDPLVIRQPPTMIERRPYEPPTIIERRPYDPPSDIYHLRREYDFPRYERGYLPIREFSPPPRSHRSFEDNSWYNRRHKTRSTSPPEYDENWIKPKSSISPPSSTGNWRDNNWNSSNKDDKKEKEKPSAIFPITKLVVEAKKDITSIEDLINPPGRRSRPPRIVIILRGPPGSGKTYLAKIIKDKEMEYGGSAPRILSLDDYFMVEQEKETVEDGKKVKSKEMVYEFEEEMEESYRSSLMKSFKKTVTDGFFSFIIVDNVNDKVKHFGEMWSFAKQNGFQVYICQMDLDVQNCTKRNIHNRTEEEIRKCVEGWEPTPQHHPLLDVTTLLQGGPISEVEMEEINSSASDLDDIDEGSEEDRLGRSKWDNFDCSVNNLAKLDGVSKPLRPSRTMQEYLQLEDEWQPTESTKPGQKRVRWADLEERKQQEKMRAIGFVVGQTDWDRMMDPTKGESALTQTKYIEKVGRRRFF